MNAASAIRQIHSWIETEFLGQMYGVPYSETAIHNEPKRTFSKSFFMSHTQVNSGRPDKDTLLRKVRPIISDFVASLMASRKQLVLDYPSKAFTILYTSNDVRNNCHSFSVSLRYNDL
jgi:hypothetical protein